MDKSVDNITSYKVDELKVEFADMKNDIKEIKDSLTRIEMRVGGLPCAVHSLRQDELEKRMDKIEPAVESTKKYVNTLAGGLVMLSLIIQLAGPLVADLIKPSKLEPSAKPHTSLAVPHSATIVSGYVAATNQKTNAPQTTVP